MMGCKKVWLLVIALCLFLLLTAACQRTDWESNIAAGEKAFQQGRYADAAKLFLVALEQAEEFGLQDPRLATSLNNLAELYRVQGKYAETEPLYKWSLAIREKVLGPEHPDVGESLNNLALLYQTQGKYDEAEPLYKRSLSIWKMALGPEHPHVATSLENYAALLRKMNREAEAVEMEALAKAIRAKHARENQTK